MTHTEKMKALGIGRKTYYAWIKDGMPKEQSVEVQLAWVKVNKPESKVARRTAPPAAPQAGEAAGELSWADKKRKAEIRKIEMQTEAGRQRIIDEEREAVTAEARELLQATHQAMTNCCPDCRKMLREVLGE